MLIMWLPYYMAAELAYAPGMAAYMSTLYDVGGMVGAVAGGFLSDRVMGGRRVSTSLPAVACAVRRRWRCRAVCCVLRLPCCLPRQRRLPCGFRSPRFITRLSPPVLPVLPLALPLPRPLPGPAPGRSFHRAPAALPER